MRLIVMFDLPTLNATDMRNYRDFRKFLIKNGFMMMQESVYTKIAFNQSMAQLIANKVKDNKPPKGLVQMFIITEKQFSRMEILVGEVSDEYITDDRRLIIL
ncbi:CRISPR-associated endonuclease Cas2 [Citroniella saccharovorans]|uniref:CRISPR-associated endoribonuclease Cas2 n=1 Tax=Citroniella saccharovorans TaxID=2053367 RepID=A0AAW9MYR2_9FIRM|nr:CRISPR-associated endonuclease Cas2 [Citroniella saccharovorans]MEB3429767.1 CRISPR-associated endonuclease Cas2 [Citroniella saccharovorans]